MNKLYMSMAYFTTKKVQTIIGSIAALCLAMGLFILVIQSANAQTSCDTYAPESTPPQGFGASWNVLSAAKEMLLKSECNRTSVNVIAGSGSNNQFIYKTGYYYKDGWHPFTFQGTSVNGTNEWLVNGANYTFQGNNVPTGTLNWIAYICQWDSAASKWKCGCRDEVCTQSFWQLQSFKASPATTDTISPCAPTNVRYTITSAGDVLLSWNPSIDNVKVYGYNIYRNGTLIIRTSNTSVLDQTSGAKRDGDVYQVSAYDGYNGTGNESAKSTSVTVHIRKPSSSQTQCPGPGVGVNQCPAGCYYLGVPYGCVTKEQAQQINNCMKTNTCMVCLAQGTKINTPQGDVAVENITPGMMVWTVDSQGKRLSAPVVRIAKMPVSYSHHVVHLTLADGRSLFVSPGHPTADGRTIGELKSGDTLNGVVVQDAVLVSYTSGYTYDILPDGATGEYFANGVLIGSTLK